MEEYSDIFVWKGVGGGKAGKSLDSYDFATTISEFEDRVALSDLQPEVGESFANSLSAIRKTLSGLDQGSSERHEWEEKFEAKLKTIEGEGLDDGSAKDLAAEVEELQRRLPAVTGESSFE